MPVIQAPSGTKGFDCNTQLSIATATAMHAAGHRFAGRYIARGPSSATNNLNIPERTLAHAAGLAILPIQHVESETSWSPSLLKGDNYGAAAAEECVALGIPAGCSVVCDLEAVASVIVPRITIAYCNAWFAKVLAGGYEPVLYVGDSCGLTIEQLYYDLEFRAYMSAYTNNVDQAPVVRGFCIAQHEARTADLVEGVDFAFDLDTVETDALGGLPYLDAPDGWLTLT